MTVDPKPTCRIFRGGDSYRGKQGFDYANGISAETAGSSGICMVLLTIAPGDRATLVRSGLPFALVEWRVERRVERA